MTGWLENGPPGFFHQKAFFPGNMKALDAGGVAVV